MIKILGLIFIICGSFGGAIWNIRFQKNRLYINESILDFIIYIKNRIYFFHENLNDVYNSYENIFLEKSGFLSFIPELGFNDALKSSEINECFDKKIQSALFDFGKKLGKSGVDEQIANCESCIQQLEINIDKMREDVPNKIKMYSSLSVISGFGIALMLI